IEAKDVSTKTLIQLIKNNKWGLARLFIPTLTDGREALIQAAQDDNPVLASALMALGASGPKALASLLDSDIQTESAGRLIAWGVDIHLAQMYGVELNGASKWSTREQLDLLGAD